MRHQRETTPAVTLSVISPISIVFFWYWLDNGISKTHNTCCINTCSTSSHFYLPTELRYMFSGNRLVVCLLLISHTASAAPPTDWDIRAEAPTLQWPATRNVENGAITSVIDGEIQKSTSHRDCLEALKYCEEKKDICKVDLEIFRQFCGHWFNERSLIGCSAQYFKECRSALRTVNLGRPNLQHCTCDGKIRRSVEELTKCNLLRRNLNSHPCLKEPPIFLPVFPLVTTDDYRETHRVEEFSPFDRGELTDNNSHRKAFLTGPKNANSTGPTFTAQITGSGSHASESNSIIKADANWLEENILVQTLSTRKLDSLPTSPIYQNESGTENAPSTGRTNTRGSTVAYPQNCLDVLEACTQQPSCARSLNRMRALCAKRSCGKLRQQCLAAHTVYRSHKLTQNCTCEMEKDISRKNRCLHFEGVVRNECAEMQELPVDSMHDMIKMHSPPYLLSGAGGPEGEVDYKLSPYSIRPANETTLRLKKKNNRSTKSHYCRFLLISIPLCWISYQE
ncbi:unnamed protein product [Dicrocoelium dendriticum]|nr:unnamed protein product [Dicrocoelium dendriticum]